MNIHKDGIRRKGYLLASLRQLRTTLLDKLIVVSGSVKQRRDVRGGKRHDVMISSRNGSTLLAGNIYFRFSENSIDIPQRYSTERLEIHAHRNRHEGHMVTSNTKGICYSYAGGRSPAGLSSPANNRWNWASGVVVSFARANRGCSSELLEALRTRDNILLPEAVWRHPHGAEDCKSGGSRSDV
jgi:hypothetical protein